MGDRANVAFRTDINSNAHVWLYTHYSGYDLPGMLLAAMKTRQAQARLTDESYLCRILIDRLMIDHIGETGYGISTRMGDNSYPIIEVDIPAQTIRVRKFDFGEWTVDWTDPPMFEQSFDEFCKRTTFEWSDAKA